MHYGVGRLTCAFLLTITSIAHVVTLYDEEDTELRKRRRGKPLRGCIGIFRDTRFGMAGRIITFQMHPWECSTNYAALVAMRCNVDVQDLRRVLPPTMWMPAEELEPVGQETEGETWHGAGWRPIRVKRINKHTHGSITIEIVVLKSITV